MQQVGPFNWQKLAGVTQPINAGNAFVVVPLTSQAPTNPPLATALSTYTSSPLAQQQKWAAAYDAATAPGAHKVPFNNGKLNLPAAGPVPVLMSYELSMARSGGLDSDLLAQNKFFGTNYTKPLLFIADGGYYDTLATNMHLTGDQCHFVDRACTSSRSNLKPGGKGRLNCRRRLSARRRDCFRTHSSDACIALPRYKRTRIT